MSPDPYVQSPSSTQGLNRYAYCMNNPVMYVDPDGEAIISVGIVVGAAVIGGIINVGIQYNMGNITDFKDVMIAFGLGSATGAVAAIAYPLAMVGLSTYGIGGFAGAAISGSASYAITAPALSSANHAIFGSSMMTWSEFGSGIVYSGVLTGLFGGLQSVRQGNSFFLGRSPSYTSNYAVNTATNKVNDPISVTVENKGNVQKVTMMVEDNGVTAGMTPKAKGNHGEKIAAEYIKDNFGEKIVGKQISSTFKYTSNGQTTTYVSRIDIVSRDANGRYFLTEVKFGKSSFTSSQRVLYGKLPNQNITIEFFGGNAATSKFLKPIQSNDLFYRQFSIKLPIGR